MRVRILTSGFNDLAIGREFYNRQAEGAGDYFLDSLFSDIDSLSLFGGIHQQVLGFYRALSKRFPYAIYYKINSEGHVVVYRVLDCRQDPAKIKRKLRSSE